MATINNSPNSSVDNPCTTVHEMLHNIALQQPDIIAAVEDQQSISYSELNSRAERIAKELLEMRVAIEQPVCVHIDRSINYLIAILAVLKSGACYVPLDPHYPDKRLEYIAENSDYAAILSETEYFERIPAFKPKTICLDSFDWQSPAPEISLPSPDENRLAYILYTSGSTAIPKALK